MANPDHLALLKKCSAAHDLDKWSAWLKSELLKDRGFTADLSFADLHGADLEWANLTFANLDGADLTGADLTGAILYSAVLYESSLRRANLTGANLTGAHLTRADLRGANLAGAELSDASLLEAHLVQVELRGAQLERANLLATDLTGAALADADLYAADLRSTILSYADLTNAQIGMTNFSAIDLSTVKGLETIRHLAPSTIGIDTLYKSGGNIPEVFLRGCGVPDTMIAFARSLVGKAIEFYSCFISYSSQDQDFAEQLHANLQAKGVRVWFAPEDLKIGDKFRSAIDEAIRLYDKLMVVLSENSIHSAWVEKEVETAFDKENREKRTVLFPIRLDNSVMATGQAWAADIRRTRHIGDFCNWKDHDDYQKAFARLLRDLQATTPLSHE